VTGRPEGLIIVPLRRMLAVLASLLVGAATLVVVPTEAMAAPNFKAPFPCNQRWTYSHHDGEVRRALDFVRSDGGVTNGTPVLASAAGTAHRFSQPSGAGNYIAVEHGGGWKTYYFHLSAYSVAEGAQVSQGQQIGVTGSTGNSTGPHIHYEQLYNGVGQNIVINGSGLAYPGSYNQYYLTSDNGCGSQPGKPFMTWGSGIRVRSDAYLSSPVVATLPGPTSVRVLCQKQGDTVNAEGYTNNWWAKLASPAGFVSNIYIDDPNAVLPGVPTC
jgi:murein DD-endopeptidase MepM/ murein hydrolase activator NlpD